MLADFALLEQQLIAIATAIKGRAEAAFHRAHAPATPSITGEPNPTHRTIRPWETFNQSSDRIPSTALVFIRIPDPFV